MTKQMEKLYNDLKALAKDYQICVILPKTPPPAPPFVTASPNVLIIDYVYPLAPKLSKGKYDETHCP